MDWGNVVIAIVSIVASIIVSGVGFFVSQLHGDVKDIKSKLASLDKALSISDEKAANTVTKEDLAATIKVTERAITDLEKMYLEVTFNITGIHADNEERDAERKKVQEDIAELKFLVNELKGKLNEKSN